MASSRSCISEGRPPSLHILHQASTPDRNWKEIAAGSVREPWGWPKGRFCRAGQVPWKEASGPLGASETTPDSGVFLFNSTNTNPTKEVRRSTFVGSVVSTNKDDCCETAGVGATYAFNRLYAHTGYNVWEELTTLPVPLRTSCPRLHTT